MKLVCALLGLSCLAWQLPAAKAYDLSPVTPLVNNADVSASNPLPTKQGEVATAGAGQYGLGLTAATSLTPPAGATLAQVCAEGAPVRYRDDGVAPTATVGIPLGMGACIQYSGPLGAVQFIQQSATATLDVSYYK